MSDYQLPGPQMIHPAVRARQARWGGVLFAAIPKPLRADPEWKRFDRELALPFILAYARRMQALADFRAAFVRLGESINAAALTFRGAAPLLDLSKPVIREIP